MLRAVPVGIGSYLPKRVLTNDNLSEMVDTNDEWIRERTGIIERHIAAENESTADMATEASKRALEAAGVNAEDIDLILVATTTPDNTFPSTACKVQAALGNNKAAAMDCQAVCTGFVYALATAQHFAASGQYKNILVIGADKLSNILDWEDRGTCILFGDGAGAIVFSTEVVPENESKGILSTHLYADGSTRELLYVDGGVSTTATVGKLRMQGQEVFKHAVQKLSAVTEEALAYNDLNKDDVDWVIPHQANMRILQSTVKRLKIPNEKLIATVDYHGNTSAASIPLAIDKAVSDGRIEAGQLLALQAIGGGLTWGSALIRW